MLWHLYGQYGFIPDKSMSSSWTQRGDISHPITFDVIMGAMESQITSFTIVYSTVHSDADQRKHQSSALLASVQGIHRWPVNSPHKWPVMRKMFPFDDVMIQGARPCPCGIMAVCHSYMLQKFHHTVVLSYYDLTVLFDAHHRFRYHIIHIHSQYHLGDYLPL